MLIDHIIKLPKLKEKNSILIIKDQYSKIIHFKTIKEVQKTKEI